jgi:GNAT superfamily N-acetyltransferase
MDTITIKTAIECDMESINNFIETHFVAMEPIIQSYQLEVSTSDSMSEIDEGMSEFYLECIQSQTTFTAYSSTNELIGVLVAGKINPKHFEETLEFANNCKDRKFANFSKLLGYVEKKADVCTRLNVQNSLHVHIISVHKDHHQRGIASKLFKKCLEEARNLKFPALSLDCTSYFSSRISEKHGLTLLSTVSYDEFNSHAGEKVFAPKEPHTLIKSYGISFTNE